VNHQRLTELMKAVQAGAVTPEEAAERLRHLPFEDLGFAKVDHHRTLRCGFPEVVFCQGKTVDQILAIVARMAHHGSTILATRASPEVYAAVHAAHPEAVYHAAARAVVLPGDPCTPHEGSVAIVSAGTSDQPVAEEARVTAEVMGCRVATFYDVGVAGIHRVLAHSRALAKASVVIVVAGMEGALASVVGGLVEAPVIAVPTSVGYGASFQGLAPLLTMLNSCAAGVAVMNIDNGFGAGCLAAKILRLGDRPGAEGRADEAGQRGAAAPDAAEGRP